MDPRDTDLKEEEKLRLKEPHQYDWFDSFQRHCPSFARIINYQFLEYTGVAEPEKWMFWHAEVLKRFFLALYGRAFFEIKSRDNFQRQFTLLGTFFMF